MKNTEEKIAYYVNDKINFSIHTFQIQISLTDYSKRKYLDILKKNFKENKETSKEKNLAFDQITRCSYNLTKRCFCNYYITFYSSTLFSHGIINLNYIETKLIEPTEVVVTDIAPHNYTTLHPRISFIVNPRKLMGYTEDLYRFIIPYDELSLIMEKITEIWSSYGFDEIDIKYATINRLDVCTNIDLGNDEIAAKYLQLLRKGKVCRGLNSMHTIYSEKSHREVFLENEFTLTNKTVNGVNQSLSIYLKRKQMLSSKKKYDREEIDKADGQLRIELRIEKERVRYFNKAHECSGDIFNDLQKLTNVFSNYLINIFGSGRFVSYTKALNIIENSNFYRKTKDDMINIIKLTKKENLSKAFSLTGMDAKKRWSMMKKFNQLDISPITVPDSWHQEFESLMSYIETKNINH